jgi:hypothetical protein
MDHDTKTRFEVTFGPLGLSKSILDRSLEVVLFNFSRDIRGIESKISSLNLFKLD